MGKAISYKNSVLHNSGYTKRRYKTFLYIHIEEMSDITNKLGLWQPTQKRLWQQTIKLANGAMPSLELKGVTYYAPRCGKGFAEGTLGAVKWAARVYSLAGGYWGKEGSIRKNILLTGNLNERVVERYRTHLAKALGEDVQKNLSRYRNTPNYDWTKCAGCDHWVATEALCEDKCYQGYCLKQAFNTVSSGWCPKHLAAKE